MSRKRLFLAGGMLLLAAALIAVGAILGSAHKSTCGAEGDARLLFCSLPDCSAPCWQSIRPGLTTWIQASNWMESSNRIEGLDCTDHVDVTYCSGSDTALEITIDICVRNDVVWSVTLAPGYYVSDPAEIEELLATSGGRSSYEAGDHAAIFGLTLADAVDALGDPDEYSAEVLTGRHGELYSTIGLYYEEGIAIETSLEDHTSIDRGFPPTCKIEIGPDLPVKKVQFYDTAQGVSWDSVLAFDSPREPWSGFGEVDVTDCQ